MAKEKLPRRESELLPVQQKLVQHIPCAARSVTTITACRDAATVFSGAKVKPKLEAKILSEKGAQAITFGSSAISDVLISAYCAILRCILSVLQPRCLRQARSFRLDISPSYRGTPSE